MKLLVIFGLFIVTPLIIEGSKILFLLPFPGPSHFLMFKVFIKELIDRGHEVTAISAYPFKERLDNYTEILIEPQWSFGDAFTQEKIFEMKFNSQFEMLKTYWWMGLESTAHAFKTAAVRDFIANDDTNFDLVVSEQFFQEAMLMFAHKYKAPIVTISTYGYSDFMDRFMGGLTPYSVVPHMVLHDYTDNMNFLQRIYNLGFSLIDVVVREFYYIPSMNKIAREHFSSLDAPLPSVKDLEKSISVLLVNSHFAMIKPRPLMPGMINIAGAHIKAPQSLPNDIKSFLDDAEHGVIYMSLGSFVKSSEMPRNKIKTILKVFGSLKQKVLWKFESDELPELPPNVMVNKWLPQSDVLAHPKIVLFIAHGGLFGTIEGTSRGVPILFMPFYGDQYKNALNAMSQGYAEKLFFSELTEKLFASKIIEMVGNKKYQTRAKEIARIINDNPMKPLDETMFWIEYVIRHKGARHFKSVSIDLPWYKYLMIDIIIVIVIAMYLVCKLVDVILSPGFLSRDRHVRRSEKKIK